MDRGSWATQYDGFAEDFEVHATDGAYNAHYDRPAVLDLIGDVAGKRVLDAGCGPGLYAEELVARGATVTGMDASPEMVRLARRRLGDRATFRRHDLEQPLGWLADGSFDVAVMALVIDHLTDRVAVLRELHRVLAPAGRLVVSTGHPTADWLYFGGSYFDVGPVEQTWRQGWTVRFWRMPLSARCDEFADAGFVIERLVEPKPRPAMRDRSPKDHEKLMHQPGFIAFRLAKAPA